MEKAQNRPANTGQVFACFSKRILRFCFKDNRKLFCYLVDSLAPHTGKNSFLITSTEEERLCFCIHIGHAGQSGRVSHGQIILKVK